MPRFFFEKNRLHKIHNTMHVRLYTSIFLFFTLHSCQSGDGYKDIRNFYFPLKSLDEGIVYEYKPVNNDSFPHEYWYYRSLFPGDSIFLSATFYAPNLIPKQQMTQKMTSTGMTLRDMYLYEPDSNRSDVQHQVPVKVVSDDVFPFKVRDNGGLFVYHIQWSPPQDPKASIRLIKNRQFLGDTTMIISGENVPVIRFLVKELLEYESDGVFEQTFSGEEWYAKGIGLVYYQKDISDAFQLAYELHDRYPMEELESTFRTMYDIDGEGNNSY